MPQGGDGQKTIPDLARNRGLFDRFNRIRFQNVYHVYPDNYVLIFKIVPLLLHINARGLPGYVEHFETPHGIKFFTPDEETLVHLHRYFSKTLKFVFKEERGGDFVEFLSVMGSVGSVAQTKRSDFDIWVGIHRDAVDDEAFHRFVEKLRGIEEWLQSLRLEVHFFPTDIKSVTNNVFGAVDEESCGSAQALMLKDEFYRTAILIAGKVPYWWMVDPAATDDQYRSFYQHFLSTNETFKEQYIDIGNIGNIDKQEFFGAALWQLVKSLHYPFKSFMKMCLIEKYLFGDTSDRISLLSNTLKERVIRQANLETEAIDSYLLMFDAVEEFFLIRERMQEAELLRTCFYMKVQPNLSSLNKYAQSDRNKKSVMDRYVKAWKWNPDQVKRLDTFYEWSMDDILKFDHDLRVYMIQTFSQLTKTRDMIGGNNLISETDLTIISRKLTSYYLPKPKKLKSFCFSFDDSVFEPELNIVKQEGAWRLYRGEARREAHAVSFDHLLYSDPHLAALCLWIANSKIFHPFYTKLSVFSSEAGVNYKEISKTIESVSENLLAHGGFKSRHYLNDPFIARLFVTCLIDPSDREARLSLFYVNSWSELFAEHYTSDAELTPILCEILSGYLRAGQPNPVSFATFHSVTGGMKELLILKSRIMDMLSAFRKHHPKRTLTLFFGAEGGQHYCYAASGHSVQYFAHANLYALLGMVDGGIQGNALSREYYFDAALGQSGYLAPAAREFHRGEFDVFCAPVNGTLSFVLFADDVNRLVYEVVPKARLTEALIAFRRFAAAAAPQRKLNFHEFADSAGKMVIRPLTVPAAVAGVEEPAFQLQAIQRHLSAVFTGA